MTLQQLFIVCGFTLLLAYLIEKILFRKNFEAFDVMAISGYVSLVVAFALF